jgi:hypothetical protein
MTLTAQFPPTATRVERSTDAHLNELIRARTDASVARMEHSTPVERGARLAELDREWDVERVLQANASTLVMVGTLLGLTVNKRFLVLPAGVLSFFLQHALQGWCPPIPIFRRRGVRTAREIERERYAIKGVRGDFNRVPMAHQGDAATRVRAILEAVDA